MTCVQSICKSIGNGAEQFQPWQEMEWPEFKKFLDWLARSSTTTKENRQEGALIWEKIMTNKDCPMDPQRIQEFAIKIGEAKSYGRKRDFDAEVEREVITHILRQMKECSKNKTLRRMTDEIKNDKGHSQGLDKFLQHLCHSLYFTQLEHT